MSKKGWENGRGEVEGRREKGEGRREKGEKERGKGKGGKSNRSYPRGGSLM